MAPYWEPGTQYNSGDVVEYEGNHYKIIQPHRSQSDWAPPITPALWGRVHQHDVYNESGQQQHQQQHHDQGNQQWQQQQQPPQQQQQNSGYDGMQQAPYQDHKPEPQQHQENKPWYKLDNDHKDAIGLAAGLIGGLGAIGGAALIYKEHEKSKEEKERAARGASNWLETAQYHTEEFYKNGPRAPYTWVLTHGKTIPHGAIVVAQEHDWLLHPARAYCDGGIQLGKASSAFQKGAVLGYQREEHHVEAYEILLGDMRGLKWVPTRGKLNVHSLGARPVDGGKENDGTPLYVAKALHKGVEHPGKASEKLDGAYIPYDGKEKQISDYFILCTRE